MYAVVRRYRLKDPNHVQELVQKVKAEFVPIISNMPGFVSYDIIVGTDTNVASVSVFDTQEQEEASTKSAAEWVKRSVSHLFDGPPELTAGKLEIHTGKKQ